jgi:uncharacterized protein
MRGLRLLQEHGVEHNILVALNRANADHPLEVYRFLRDKAQATWIQFIPVVERIDDAGHTIYQRGTRISERSVRPEQLGRFLIRVFDEWVRHDVGRVYVQTFEAAVRNWLGMPSSGMCVFEPTCGLGPALEHNGDLYSCDHFVEPDYLLGNILETPMAELAASERQRRFGKDKRDGLPAYCRECKVRFACHGECPKNRFAVAPNGEPGLNYLCAGWKAFFQRIDEPLQTLATLMRVGRPASHIMDITAGKEGAWQEALARARARKRPRDPCPCCSGLGFGECHGWVRPKRTRRRRGGGARQPRPPARREAR